MAVIKISTNATNSDVIKALFNPYKICVYEYSVHVYITKENFDTCDDYVVYAREWWDAEYKEPTIKNNLGVDVISRADALRVAKNEYLRGWHNALCKALDEEFSIHCKEGNFNVIQEETITGLGLSMDCTLGKDVESYMSTMPSVTPQEPCEDVVSRKAVRNTIFAECSGVKLDIDFAKVLLLQRAIKALPSATLQEPRKGHWIEHPNEWGANREWLLYECSECHECSKNDSDFCPNCGVDMREVEE